MRRLENVESQLVGQAFELAAYKRRIAQLDEQVAELVTALEWHVGTSVEILLGERNLTKLKVAEHKSLVEETGSTELVNPVNTERGERDGEARTKVD